MKGIHARTTNDRWEVVDLSTARDYNKDKKHIFVFKQVTVDSMRVCIQDNENQEIPLIINVPIMIRVCEKKKTKKNFQFFI